MDNHTNENCFRTKPKTSKLSHEANKYSTRANHVDDTYEASNIAQAFSASSSNHMNVPHSSSKSSSSIKSRLGTQVKSPYDNIVPQRNHSSSPDDDILDINYKLSEGVDYMSDSGTISIQSIAKHSENFIFQINHAKSLHNSSTQPPDYPISCMNHKNILKLRSLPRKMNLNPKHSNFSHCVSKMNFNKNNMNSISSIWIVDSGASMHMCGSKSLVKNFTPQKGENVVISDGSKIPIEGYGTIEVKVTDSLNNFHTLSLPNVAVVPKLSVNLISVAALTKDNSSIIFTNNSCFLQNSHKTIKIGNISKALYKLEMQNKENPTTSALTCIHDWHRKLGHRNIQQIKKIKETLNLQIEKCNCQPDCFACLQGKFTALPFPQKSEKPENPREIIATDVCGPFRTSSIGGSRYFITFTCLHSDYTEVAAIKQKSEAKEELIKFINKCQNQFDTPIKVIRSDRGGEFIDGELQRFLNQNGIISQFTVAGNPQQNGVAERKNRTLVEAIRTLLFAKNLPKYLWAEALHHANNTFNNIPKRSNLQSPKEIFFGKAFKVQFLEFGSEVFYTTNPQGRSKLDERACTGIFVGIDHCSRDSEFIQKEKSSWKET